MISSLLSVPLYLPESNLKLQSGLDLLHNFSRDKLKAMLRSQTFVQTCLQPSDYLSGVMLVKNQEE